MAGKIHSDQRCPICNGRFAHDENRHGLFCSGNPAGSHPETAAPGTFRVYFKSTTKRFRDYYSAERFLNFLRAKQDENDYDPRDYRQDAPLGFSTLAIEYIQGKEKEGLKSINNLRNYMRRAREKWGQKNVKSFTKGDIKKLLYGIEGISDKTRFNHLSCLRDFFKTSNLHWSRWYSGF